MTPLAYIASCSPHNVSALCTVFVCLSECMLLVVALVWPACLHLWSDRIKPIINDAGRWRSSDAVQTVTKTCLSCAQCHV